MIGFIPFLFKSLAVASLCFYWAGGLERSRHVMIVISFGLFFLTLSSFPFGYIDVVSGDYIESGSVLLLLILYLLQTMVGQRLERSRVNIILDLVLPLTLLSASVRYGTFNLAVIASRQSNLSSLGIPQVGLVYDPINAVLFYWLCFIKFKNIQLKRHLNGQLPYQLCSEFQLNSALLLGLFFFLGGVPALGIFNIDSSLNHLIQTIGASLYLVFYLFIVKKIMNLLSRVFFPLSDEVIEKAVWTRFVPTSIVAFILSVGIFVMTGGRF